MGSFVVREWGARLAPWGAGFLLLASAPLFFVGGLDWTAAPLLRALWDFGHLVFFALLVFVVVQVKLLPRWQQWLGLSLAALLVSGLIELVQHWVGRHASWGDIGNNLIGVWLGLFWGQRRRAPALGFTLGRSASLLLAALAAWPVLSSAWVDWSLRRAFPLINGFETVPQWQQLHFNPARVKAQLSRDWVSQGQQSLQLDLAPEGYAGLRLRVCYGDWSGYTSLAMDLYNPGSEPLALTLRLSDQQHDRTGSQYQDRFNRRLWLAPGWNPVRVTLAEIQSAPQGRNMDMTQLCNLGLFGADLGGERRVYLDNIRLLPEQP